MTKGIRRTALLLAAATLATLAPLGARATHCNSGVGMFFYGPGAAVGLDPAPHRGNTTAGMPTCSDTPDRLVVVPGSTAVRVRWLNNTVPPLSADVAVLSGTLNGLGLNNVEIALTRNAAGTEYQTAILTGMSATATGCIAATVTLPDPATPETVKYHTISGSCS